MTWVLGGALMLVIIATAAGFEDPHGVGYDGRDWKVMSEQAKLAYVAGFLAGAAASWFNFRWLKQLVDSLGSPETGRRPQGSLPSGRRRHTAGIPRGTA